MDSGIFLSFEHCLEFSIKQYNRFLRRKEFVAEKAGHLPSEVLTYEEMFRMEEQLPAGWAAKIFSMLNVRNCFLK